VDKEIEIRVDDAKKIDARVALIEQKMKDGICTYCSRCGGDWPQFMGEITADVKEGKMRAASCGGDAQSHSGEGAVSLCCVGV